MTSHAIRSCAVLLLLRLTVAGPAAAQETRTFAEAQCSYTLPGPDWGFLDTASIPDSGMKNLVLARNQNGLVMLVRYKVLAAGDWPGPRTMAEFESGYLKGAQMTKHGSREVTFQGIACHEFDGEVAGGMGTSVRAFFANDRFYVLQAAQAGGPLSERDADTMYQGFKFTVTPVPVAEVTPAYAVGQLIGLAVIVGIVAGGIYLLVRLFRTMPDQR